MAAGSQPRTSALALVFFAVVAAGSAAQPPTQPIPAVPLDPINAILDAFRDHAVVALSEGTHGNEQGLAFRLSLIRDSRFLARVNDIVLEGANARYQDVMDRYVRGDDVPVESLRRVWDDTTQQQAGGPMWTGAVPEFYRAIPQMNASLPPARHLRILLADPPIDWDQVHTRADHAKWIALRDTFPAALIEREVLARNRRALIVFGNMHLQRKQMLANYDSAGDGPLATVVSALEESGSRKRVFSIWTATDAELSDLQSDVATWPIPSLAILRGTVLGAADFSKYFPSQYSAMSATRFAIRDGKPVPIPRDQWRSLKMEDQFDAALYLGPRAAITVSRVRPSPAVCADPAFLERRLARLALTGLPPVEVDRVKQLCVQSPK
jgi:hypothetical protein